MLRVLKPFRKESTHHEHLAADRFYHAGALAPERTMFFMPWKLN
jgi:hypothetical protein